jgi:hypothetical protein
VANPAEIPQLVTELVDMSKAYLQQETVDPLKKVGRYAGFSIGGGLLLAVGWLLVVMAILRWVTELLPSGDAWEALAYVIAAIVGLGIAGISMKIAAARTQKPESRTGVYQPVQAAQSPAQSPADSTAESTTTGSDASPGRSES